MRLEVKLKNPKWCDGCPAFTMDFSKFWCEEFKPKMELCDDGNYHCVRTDECIKVNGK